MRHPDWDESENENYNRLSKVREGSIEGQIEGLAYTAVMEMYHARKEKEKLQTEKKGITDALYQMAYGIRKLEMLLGISIEKMSQQHFAQKLAEAHEEEEMKLKRTFTRERNVFTDLNGKSKGDNTDA